MYIVSGSHRVKPVEMVGAEKVTKKQRWGISIGIHTHSSPIWEIIVLAILKIVQGEGDF